MDQLVWSYIDLCRYFLSFLGPYLISLAFAAHQLPSVGDRVHPLVKVCEKRTEVDRNNRASVIIVNWNDAWFLARCLAALMAPWPGVLDAQLAVKALIKTSNSGSC